jgi:hypothetical protein
MEIVPELRPNVLMLVIKRLKRKNWNQPLRYFRLISFFFISFAIEIPDRPWQHR